MKSFFRCQTDDPTITRQILSNITKSSNDPPSRLKTSIPREFLGPLVKYVLFLVLIHYDSNSTLWLSRQALANVTTRLIPPLTMSTTNFFCQPISKPIRCIYIIGFLQGRLLVYTHLIIREKQNSGGLLIGYPFCRHKVRRTRVGIWVVCGAKATQVNNWIEHDS